MNNMFDTIIIGSGAAGMSAAIYAKRSGLAVVMIEASAPGGQINKASTIENYPGVVKIDGPSLAMNMFQQTQEMGIEYHYGNVLNITEENKIFKIKTDVEEIDGKTIIVASGRKSKELGLEKEKTLTGRGISWCAICDGPLFKDQEVVVVGGGNSAVEEALYLADICKKVTVIHRRDSLRADKSIQEQLFKNKKIKVIWDTTVSKFYEQNNRLSEIEITNIINNKKKKIKCAGVFIFIGFDPVTDMVSNFNITNDNKYIVVDENMRTSHSGIYACGDVISKKLYQIVTATSEGAKAAMSVVEDLSK